jgi:hypothetical protein
MYHFTSFLLKFKSSLLVKRVFSLLNAAFAMAILYLLNTYGEKIILKESNFYHNSYSSVENLIEFIPKT